MDASNYTILPGWFRWHVYRLGKPKPIETFWWRLNAEAWVRDRERKDKAHRLDTYVYAKYNQDGPHRKPGQVPKPAPWPPAPSPDWRDDSKPDESYGGSA